MFDTADLTAELEDKGYDAIDDIDNVIVDNVDDFPALFREVRDLVDEEFKITMQNRPTTAYIDPKDANY